MVQDGNKANKAVGALSARVKQLGRNVKSTRTDFVGSVAGMAGAAGALTETMSFLFDASKKNEEATRRVASSIGATGVRFQDVQGDVQGTIDKLSDFSSFSETQLLNTLATLTDQTGSYTEGLQALPVVMDIAAARQTDLATAAGLFDEAIKTGSGELATYVQSLEATEDPQARFALLQQEFAGAALSNVDPVRQLSNSFGELAAELQVHETIEAVASALRGFAELLADKLPPGLLKTIGQALAVMLGVLTAAAVIGQIAALVAAFNPLVLGIAAIAAAAFLIWKNWDTIWGGIQDGFSTVVGTIVGLYESGFGWLLPGGPLIKALLFLRDNWEEIWSTMRETASAVWSGIGDVVKGNINAIIELVNGVIRKLNAIQVTIPNFPGLPGRGQTIGFNIPEIATLAAGGIVTRPTLGLLGEAGPEAVVPLSRGGGAVAGGGGLTINVNFPSGGTVILDNEASARRLATEITQHVRDALRGQRDF